MEESFLSQVNGTYNPVAAAQNASANTDGTSTEKATNAVYAAGGAVAAGAGAAFVATKNTGARAVGATTAAVTPSSNGSDLSEKSTADLQAEVKKLRSQVESLQKSQSGQSSDGISIQVVAALCFGVFAFTYLFL